MSQPPGAIPAVDAAEAADRLSRADAPKPLLVDVRETDEFRDVRVEGAALIPMSSFAERHAELPKDRPLLVMCAGGTRSAAATVPAPERLDRRRERRRRHHRLAARRPAGPPRRAGTGRGRPPAGDDV